MKNFLRYTLAFGCIAAFAGRANAACETTPSTPIGAGVFGATVQTFIDLGINPAVTCLENALWSNPSGFGLGTYIKGAEGFGTGTDNTTLGQYDGSGGLAANANALDHAWVQDTSSGPIGVGDGPSSGIIWDLGGQANQAVVFVFVDHGPVPGEVLENTVWLSDDPDAADGGWTQAELVHVYGDGWDGGAVISDGFVAQYKLPGGATFRYVSVTWGGPGAIVKDGDNEIDAVGGLTAEGTGVSVPEPTSILLLGSFAGIAWKLRRRVAKA